ncbi:uncharacterized protein AMSG_08196 [Thecamonas trahens ATCC 50062]|uniref:Ubiquitin carboxyl-terminal hydrolase n=1 Tax=Thecamonas trahens ATCC 50062 TaxID=461836 RepID=A0A0L0DHV6_THETB|nr:hypothetical protein AMSG_08196 [Thecamonas trahens ATCC 50062]KNC51949.1 hypothetical protein AMSG_08196 [Thecamonas trahens ATCC 50062]|eukprot:XP_013755540.1 hypothetical protein AMSG_08196 [Thecamonas trahens ATCC 50062]
MEEMLKMLQAAYGTKLRGATERKSLLRNVAGGEVGQVVANRVGLHASGFFGEHKTHHYHTLAPEALALLAPGEHVTLLMCCNCHAFARFRIVPSPSPDPCPHPAHHYHYAEMDEVADGEWSTGAVPDLGAACCGCSRSVDVVVSRPVVPREVLKAVRMEAAGHSELVDTAYNTLGMYMSKLASGDGKGKRINSQNKGYLRRLGALPSTSDVLAAVGFVLAADGFWDPPDPDDPDVLYTLTMARVEMAFEASHTLSVAEMTAGRLALDPTDATGLIRDALCGDKSRLLHARGKEASFLQTMRPLAASFVAIGLATSASDEAIVWAAQLAIDEARERTLDVLDAIKTLQAARNSPALTDNYRRLLRENGSAIQELTGLGELGLEFSASDDHVVATYYSKREKAPHLAHHLKKAATMVARGRPESATLSNLVETLDLPSPTARRSSHTASAEMTEEEQVQAAILESQRASAFLRSPGPEPSSPLPSPSSHLERAAFALRLESRAGLGLPCGLLNIGQTCYFNSLIQALFAFQPFRLAILAAPAPGCTPSDEQSGSEHVAAFVAALQELFAYMALGKAKTYNSSKLMAALRHESGAPVRVGLQEDVAEYINVFLEQAKAAFASADAEAPNPVTELFYGELAQVLAYSQTDEAGPVPQPATSVPFNRLILDVDAGSMHAALDAYTAPTQTTRLASAPPALILQVSRVVFSPATQAGIKIDDPFEFPDKLFLDRYLAENAERVAELAEHDALLAARIDELAHELVPGTEFDALSASMALLKSHSPPGAVAAAETLSQLRSSLEARNRLIAEQTAAIKAEREALFSELDKTAYVLHAVLVHDGYASSGHYYAYVRQNPDGSTWFRLDDATVSMTTAAEVWKHATGGHKQASGYCFMYVKAEAAAAASVVSDPVMAELPERAAAAARHRNTVDASNTRLFPQS